MAHEVEQMFSVKQTPWHGLGEIVREAPNVESAIKLAGLDWPVEMRALHTVQGSIPVKKCAIVRGSDESVLGVAGPDYQPLQNDKAFEFFNPFLESGECKLETAGSLKKGKRIWVMAKLNRDPIAVTKNDLVEKFLLLSNSHEGHVSVRVGFTPVRVVCANTLAMATGDARASLLRVTHKSNMKEGMERVQEIVNTANAAFEATAEQYKVLAKTNVSAKDIEKYVKLVFVDRKTNSERKSLRLEKMTETITRLFETGQGNDVKGVRGTAWALYNGATEYLSYEIGKDADRRLNSLWFGRNLKRNKKAFDVAMSMAVH
jgi:phage/plasmid-like protein (TIGR03299 family)